MPNLRDFCSSANNHVLPLLIMLSPLPARYLRCLPYPLLLLNLHRRPHPSLLQRSRTRLITTGQLILLLTPGIWQRVDWRPWLQNANFPYCLSDVQPKSCWILPMFHAVIRLCWSS